MAATSGTAPPPVFTGSLTSPFLAGGGQTRSDRLDKVLARDIEPEVKE